MKLSRNGLAQIKKHEGVKLESYRDPVGIWTIGMGHTSMAGPPHVVGGMKITLAEANTIFRRDVQKFADGVAVLIHVPLTQGQADALVSLAYNIGLGAFKNSTLLRRLNARDYEGAAREFPRWRKAGGRVLNGLVARRAAEKALFLSNTSLLEDRQPREVEPDNGKPLVKSTTVWTAILAAASNALMAVVGLGKSQPILAGFMVVLAVGFAVYLIRERKRHAVEGMI